MSSEDFRLIKPVPLTGVVPFTRPSPKWVYDRTGTLVEVPANTLGVTYDPADLSKAPWALLEPAATNGVRNNTMQGGTVGQLGAGGVMPNAWQVGSNIGIAFSLIGKGNEFGIEYIDVRIFGNATGIGFAGIYFDGTTAIPAAAGDNLVTSVFCIHAGGSRNNVDSVQVCLDENSSTPSYVTGSSTGINLDRQTWNANCRAVHSRVVTNPAVAFASPHIKLFNKGAGPIDIMLRIGLPQIERDRLTSPIKTSGSTVTRAADVVGAGAGLVYSNVPITEPLWAAGTYALGARVRDAGNFVFESLAASNTAVLTEKTKWLPLGLTNRLKMLDKAVNSQTTWPDELVVVVKASQLANVLTVLNVTGASISVAQSGSGYSRVRSLVSHDVLSWYDFYYQDPLWIGDTVFDDLPPYIDSVLTVVVRSPANQAAIGGFFLGKSKFIGKTQWGLTAGILSYSGATADIFGNVTLMKRDSAKKMNFEVAIPRGYEDEVYRFMKSAENVEMVAIASSNWSMTISYGYLGQWEVPLSIDGKKMPVEWRGLI
jgi:hypothetical protein